jgi:hypothetical protein
MTYTKNKRSFLILTDEQSIASFFLSPKNADLIYSIDKKEQGPIIERKTDWITKNKNCLAHTGCW